MGCLEKRLKKARNYARLTQPKLADLLGVSIKTVKNYEKDASKVTVLKVKNIALICNVDEIWLLTGQGSMEINVQGKQTTNESSKVIIIQHQDLVTRYKDPQKGLEMNERLIDIEATSEELYSKADSYIKGLHDAVMVMKKLQKKPPKKSDKKEGNEG